MIELIKSWFGVKKEPFTEFVVPIIAPGGGMLNKVHVWARSDRDARLAVMGMYDISAFIIGPATPNDDRT